LLEEAVTAVLFGAPKTGHEGGCRRKKAETERVNAVEERSERKKFSNARFWQNVKNRTKTNKKEEDHG